MSELESGFRLADVIGLLRRRSAIVLGSTILGLVAGYLVFSSAPPNYSATSRVEVEILKSDPNSTGGTLASQSIDLGTESDKVKSDAVGDAVRKKLDLSGDNRSLFRPLVVTSKDNSRVLELTYESYSATRARAIVNAIAQSYLDVGNEAAKASRDKKLAALGKDITRAKEALRSANIALDATASGTAARTQAGTAAGEAQQAYTKLLDQKSAYEDLSTTSGQLVRKAPLPETVLSKKAVGMGVGVFGLVVMAGLGLALLVDRRDSLGGGQRRVQKLAPGANMRIMPTANGGKAGPAEIDAAIDRLAVELAGGGSNGRAASVLVAGTRMEPPVALAEELASSLTFAGIPALFVLAGSAERELRQAHVITSFTDLITGPSITGPASLPDRAGSGAVNQVTAPTVTWLRPRGSAEASGLLRRAVVEALITRAGREGFEAVVFVAATPTRNAAAAALGQWVAKTAVIVEGNDTMEIEQTVSALVEADVTIAEVVWT